MIVRYIYCHRFFPLMLDMNLYFYHIILGQKEENNWNCLIIVRKKISLQKYYFIYDLQEFVKSKEEREVMNNMKMK